MLIFQSFFGYRIARFYELLYGIKNDVEDNCVNIHSLREICFENGCPDEDKHIRSIVWKLLLGYLPSNRDDWDKYLSEKRQLYRDFVSDYMIEDNKLDSANNDHVRLVFFTNFFLISESFAAFES